MKRRRLLLIIIISIFAGAAIASAIVILILHRNSQTSLLPKHIVATANFTLYAPEPDKTTQTGWNFTPNSASYDKDSGVVSSTFRQASSGVTVVITQQVTPGVFDDVPQQYSKVLNSLNEYDEIQTSFGTVALTHPKELSGGQTAVVNKSGTLLFARPSHDLNNTQWQQFFEDLRIVR